MKTCQRTSIETRFLKHINKTGDCWLWTAFIQRDGYGRITTTGRQIKFVHRVAWEIAYGPIPKGMLVCHKCDVRHCVNPDHLFLGTIADNVKDMVAKGRNAVGESSGNVKLTASDVKDIRRLYKEGLSMRSLGRRFGVGGTTIGYIVRRETWAHIP